MNVQLRSALVMFLFLSLASGVFYPLVVTGLASAAFAAQADGSLIERDRQPVGSTLIGQAFSSAEYFWGRPSATATHAYNSLASGGSNLGPLNPALVAAVNERMTALRAADPGNTAAVPVDLVTASASGLDPHISRAAADYQATRVARARGIAVDSIRELIDTHTSPRWLGIFGEPTVHVLELNLALDDAQPRSGS